MKEFSKKTVLGLKRFLKGDCGISSSKTIFCLSLYFLIFMNISLWEHCLKMINFSSFFDFLFALSLPVLIFTIEFMLFSVVTVPYIGKFLVSLLILTSSVTNYTMHQFGIFMTSDMIRNVFETNTAEVKDLITFASASNFIIFGILPVLLLFRTKIIYGSLFRELTARLKFSGIFLLSVLVLSPFVYKQYMSYGRNNHETLKLVNPISYIDAVFKYVKEENLKNKKIEKIDPSATHSPYKDEKQTVIVFILGEAARSANFSLNGYPRDTNPELKKDGVISFRDVKSAGTATAYSVPIIFSSKGRGDFKTGEGKYEENIMDLLQNTGYQVLWKENDNGCKGVCDRVPTVFPDVNDKRFCDGDTCRDEFLLDGLEDYIRNVKGNAIIVLHTIGSHGPAYYKRYPPEFKKFTPTCDSEEIQNCPRENIINAYDNTILHTDHIISGAIAVLKKFKNKETGLVYTSDHGESLGENGIYLHGMPYSIAPDYQTHVPLIFWASEDMIRYDHLDIDCIKEEAEDGHFSHDNIFHSIVGLTETRSKLYKKDLDIFNKCRKKPLP